MRNQWQVSPTQHLGLSEFPADQDSYTHIDVGKGKHVPVIASITIFLFTITLLLTLGIVTISPLLTSQSPNPVATYEAIMPGQSDTLLEANNCRPMDVPRLQNIHYCEIAPRGPVIQRIVVTSFNNKIQHMTFAFNYLPLGYLLLWWGEPDSVETSQELFIARWGPQWEPD